MPKKCCVDNCKIDFYEASEKNIHLHGVPGREGPRKSWLEVLKHHSSNAKLNIKSLYVCSQHFEKDDFLYAGMNKYQWLKNDVVPSIFWNFSIFEATENNDCENSDTKNNLASQPVSPKKGVLSIMNLNIQRQTSKENMQLSNQEIKENLPTRTEILQSTPKKKDELGDMRSPANKKSKKGSPLKTINTNVLSNQIQSNGGVAQLSIEQSLAKKNIQQLFEKNLDSQQEEHTVEDDCANCNLLCQVINENVEQRVENFSSENTVHHVQSLYDELKFLKYENKALKKKNAKKDKTIYLMQKQSNAFRARYKRCHAKMLKWKPILQSMKKKACISQKEYNDLTVSK